MRLSHKEENEETGTSSFLERWPRRTWQGTEPVCGKQSVKLMSHYAEDGSLGSKETLLGL